MEKFRLITIKKQVQAGKPTAQFSAKEQKAFEALGEIPADDFDAMRRRYTATSPEDRQFLRRTVLTLLSHWQGELDQARHITKEEERPE